MGCVNQRLYIGLRFFFDCLLFHCLCVPTWSVPKASTSPSVLGALKPRDKTRTFSTLHIYIHLPIVHLPLESHHHSTSAAQSRCIFAIKSSPLTNAKSWQMMPLSICYSSQNSHPRLLTFPSEIHCLPLSGMKVNAAASTFYILATPSWLMVLLLFTNPSFGWHSCSDDTQGSVIYFWL